MDKELIDVTIQEFDLQKNPEVLNEFLTTEWDMVDTEHFGEVTRLYSQKRFIYVVREEKNNQIIGYAVLETNMGVATIVSIEIGRSSCRERAYVLL